MPKTSSKNKKSIKKTQSEQKVQSLLSRQILLKEQVEFYKKHSNAKTLIIIFILLVLILMYLYINDFGNPWISELKTIFLNQGLAQAGM